VLDGRAVLTTYRRIFTLLSTHERRRFWLICGMIFAMALFELAGVVSIMPFLAVLSNPQVVETNSVLHVVYTNLGFTTTRDFLPFLGVVTLCIIFFGQIFKAVTTYVLSRFSNMREYSIGSRLLGSYLHQPYAWFLGRHSADLGKSVLSEVSGVITGLLMPALRLLAYGTTATVLILFLVITEPVAALSGALVIGGGYLGVFVVTRRYLDRIGDARLRANTERFTIAQEALGGIKDVKLLSLEGRFLRRFRRTAERFAHYQAMAMAIREVPRFLLEAIVFGAMMAFLLVLLLSSDGQLTEILPTIGLFAFAGARIFAALQQVYRSASAMRFGDRALTALCADFQDRATEAVAPAAASAADVPCLRDRIEFKDVGYTYPGADRSALDGLDLTIRANTTVGVVGASGAGKTTAVDVLLGLLSPQRGELTVDGRQIDSTNVRAWQRQLGYVPQHIFLTDDTIAANIAFGLSTDEIDMTAVERAARIAELHEFVVGELPDGYMSTVGERGVRLSGGQRQRIGIARALYHDPDVLVLDEATSALDNLTERAVMDAVGNLAHAKTIVMIAHRLSTVRNCDEILMLEGGRCTAAADYDTLVQQHGSFRELAAVSGH